MSGERPAVPGQDTECELFSQTSLHCSIDSGSWDLAQGGILHPKYFLDKPGGGTWDFIRDFWRGKTVCPSPNSR
jgi:hypothetical protein